MGIMMGKAVKLAEGNEDTHSRNVTMNRIFIAEMATESGVTGEPLQQIMNMTLARDLWQIIPSKQLQSFIDVVRSHCLETLSPLLQGTDLTIHILSDEGEIF